MMNAFPGYQILAQIYDNGNSAVYRAMRQRDHQPVILKLLQEEYPTPEEISKYEREYKILSSLNLNGVIKAYDYQSYQNSVIMILEDFGGESLKILMATQKFTLLGFLNLAIKIAEGLREIHAMNLIHKDINPSNIVFNPATGQVKLIDFSITSVVSRENLRPQNLNKLEGTLAYISPEQTGRMNRSLDYRTDFYSLGATFYEILTQQVPFPTTDAMELVHAHLAKQPAPPQEINPEIPKIVSNIVLKLLAKTPEDRYQSAWGLIADLEECLKQLQATGTIEEFPLGVQDISDQFKIPKKLYGREQEIDVLVKAFKRVSQGTTEMLLVAGYSGIGKSVLVQEIAKLIIQKNGYFISGKFDQFQRSIPYSAIVSAFSELVRLLLSESQEKLNQWREKLLTAFGPNGQIIVDVIPEVELIVGPQPAVQELGPTESQNRFNLVFQNFIRLFCQPQHPLVIFLDDLQWADSATLKLIKLMMTDEATRYLFLIGAYRDNEVSKTHPLIMMIDSLRSQSFKDDETEESTSGINQLTLYSLNLDQVSQLIADTLHSDRTTVKPLAELVVHKTEGNPFFVNEFLKTLYQEKLLTFDSEHICWQWDLEQIKALDITDNVVELMIGKLQKLPVTTQQVLQLVACVGNQFDLNTLSLIYEKESSDAFQDLLPALREGLIKPASELDGNDADRINPLLVLNYKFLHDRVQQAAYSLIEDSKKQAVHLKIGRLLLSNTPEQYRSERVFDLVDHLNVGRDLITDHQEKVELAQLNLEAGKKAKYATAYVAAREYLIAGMDILGETIWNEHYDLAFTFYRERSDVEYLNGNFSVSEALIQKTLERAKTVLEKTEIYNLLLIQYTLRAKNKEAAIIGQKALALLDINLPQEDLPLNIQSEFSAIQTALGNRAIIELLEQPEMTNFEQRMALKLLNSLAPSTYLTNPQLWTVIILKGVKLCIEFGYSPEADFFYSTYGIILATGFEQYKTGYEFGQLGFKLSQKWRNPIYKACSCLISCLDYWLHPVKDLNSLANEGYQSALESGDLQYAGYLLNNKTINLVVQGVKIPQLLVEIGNYLQFSRKTENQLVTDTLKALEFALRELTQKNLDQCPLNPIDEPTTQYLEYLQQTQNLYSLCIYKILKLQSLYLLGKTSEALTVAFSIRELLQFIVGLMFVTEYNFYLSLTLVAAFPDATPTEQEEYLSLLQTNQKQMKTWADNCPENFLHKYLLVEAEISRIQGQKFEAIEFYDQAIASAKENGFIQNEALSHELTAKFWFSHNKPKYAETHLREAYYGYHRWGAICKVENLEIQYPLLKNISSHKSSLLEAQISTLHTSQGSRLEMLDFNTVMKASQAISREIVLDKLLANLMKILIENAGAQKGILILANDGKLLIEAEAQIDSDDVIVQKSIPLETYTALPSTVIHYVERTRQDVVLMNACLEGQFTADSYIVENDVKSILCTSIMSQRKLLGILYLENNLTVGAFTSERIEVLRLLSAQATVSLENALLYTSVEKKVQERTQELNEKNTRLEQTLHELQWTQAQLIQSEKMSSLGQMVAGVAHEINNPVSFIYGNLTPASEYVQDLLSIIEAYQQEYPNPTSRIKQTIHDLDLDFLIEDLQKLLGSMKVGAERISNIVLSLRNFSRLDEADMKPVDIHEGIESTLMILQPRLRASGSKREIEVIKNYDSLPKVNCYASQLNQVFMNILSNSIDALDCLRINDEQQPNSPLISISTFATSPSQISIRIRDNGPGMGEEVLQRIFDPFFTTKPVGSGTGLGLSISYSIIVERHRGELSCISAPGEGTEFLITIPTH